MTVSLKHKFVSAIPDGTDATIVRPSNWNDEHAITGTANKLFGFDNTGAAAEVTVGSGLTYSAGTLIATGDGTGTVTSINVSGGTTGVTFSGGPVTTSGTITMGGTLAVANGGTGVTTSTGSGNNVLSTGASLTTPTQTSYETWTSISAPSYAKGLLWYDSTQEALAYYNDVTGNPVHIGQETILKVINNTGSTIPFGSPVYITSTSSGSSYPNVALARADVTSTAAVIGITNTAITNGSTGYVVAAGMVTGINTSSFGVGDVLYLSPYSAGQIMNTVPPTGYVVQIGVCAYGHASSGSIYTKQTTPLSISANIVNVGQLAVANGGTGQASYTNGQLLIGNTTGNTLTKATLTAGTNVSITNGSGSITINATDQYTGTVTSVAALTLGTTGTDLSSSVANSTTTPVITLNVPTASATNRGVLSSTDWTTFNNKGNGTVTSVTATSPVASTGGTTPVISMPAATTSVSGYLTNTDWTTFNNKGNGTVTSVTATSPVASTGGATPVISMPAATASVSGYLTSTDWTTFNNKGSGTVTSVTGTAPVVSSGGATPAISMAAATTSVNGYLTSTDWNTFNGKQAALVSGTSIKTVSGTSLLGSGDVGTISVAYGGTGQTTYTDGQLLIGNSTGNTLTKATLTAGSGITITNGSGAITIAASSSGITQAKATALSLIFGV
jgi:hypothetical protein